VTALIKKPPAETPEADVARADAAITLVSNRLAEAQADVAELRRSVGETAFLAEVDPALRSELLAVRARLAAVEARVAELTAAEQVGRDLAAEAKRRALAARKGEDWQAAADLLEEALTTARALDAVVQQAGSLCVQIKQQLAQAATRVSPHLSRVEYNIPPPDLNATVLVLLDRAGGPRLDPMRALTAAASLAEAVAGHATQVLRHRPVTEKEPRRE
jgi:hypothetical protein